ncbi:LysR family transcriptional regulator [Chitinimonas koreensis]|uniref:LysR family transcriptional regulator n=1 Tax=Chitinimonas koreensis TaxID=356302 RepID=UPI000406B79F|nr:LysR family transcriptional regulator [Chitinimonas koreensis]
MLKLDQMAVFAQVVESGSFTAAAARLGLPKSTVSQRLAELEAALGVRLLQRTTRKLSLTGAGQAYLVHCQAMLEAARAADAAVSRLRDAPAGRLRITVPEASGVRLLPELLAAFRARHPQIELDCLVTDAHLDLVADRIDLAFRTGRLHDSSHVSRRVGTVRRVLVASPGYLAREGEPGRPEELARHACLLHASAPQWLLRGEQGTVAVTPAAGYSANSLCHLLEAAAAGAGIAMLPAFLCRDELANGRLRTLLDGCPPVPNDYYAVYPSRSHLPAALLALLDFVEEWDLAARLA